MSINQPTPINKPANSTQPSNSGGGPSSPSSNNSSAPSSSSPTTPAPPPTTPPTMPPSVSPILIPGIKPKVPPIQNKLDGYGCPSAAGFVWSPSEGMCCKQLSCKDPQPWVCDANQLPNTGSMDWHGCKNPKQMYDYQSGNCCNAICITPNFNQK